MGLQLALALVALVCVTVHSQDLVDLIGNNAPVNVTLFETLVRDFAPSTVRNALTDTGFSGTAFIPSDTAFQTLLDNQGLATGDLTSLFVGELLRDHVIINGGTPVQGSDETKTYTTWADVLDNQVDVTFDASGSVTAVMPSEEFSLRAQSSVVGVFEASNSATVYYMDTVIITKGFYDRWIGNGAKNLLQAIAEVNAENDNIIFDLAAAVSSRPALVDTFNNTGLQGTLFAPKNDAFVSLLTMLGANSFGDLPATDGLNELVDVILMYHFVPAGPAQPQSLGMVTANPNFHTGSWDNTEFNTLLGQDLGTNITLNFMDPGNWNITHGIDSQFMTNATAGFTDVKITTPNGLDWKSPANDGTPPDHNAHLHVINDVLLPIPEDAILNLDGYADQGPESYSTFKDVLSVLMDSGIEGVSDRLNVLLNTPVLRGAMFVPSNAAFNRLLNDLDIELDFLTNNPSILLDVIRGHIIFDVKMTGAGAYPTLLEDYQVTVNYDGDMPSSFERTRGGVPGLRNVSTVQGSYGPTANGFVANQVGGMGNGFVHFVDQVIVPGPTAERVLTLLRTPASEAIADEAAEITDDSYTKTSSLIERVGLNSVLDGETGFTFFYPSDEALAKLVDVLDLSNDTNIFDLLNSAQDTVLNIMETHIVMADQYGSDGLQRGETYETRAGTYIKWESASNTYIVGDSESEVDSASRKLLSQHTKGDVVAGGDFSFGDGKKAITISSPAITTGQQASLRAAAEDEGAASMPLPSLGLLVAALLAVTGIVA